MSEISSEEQHPHELVWPPSESEDGAEDPNPDPKRISFPLSLHKILQIEALLNRMVQKSFMLDASLWGVKTFMVKKYFETETPMHQLGRNAIPGCSNSSPNNYP